MNRSGIPTLNAGAYDNLPGSSLRLSGDQRPTYTQRRRNQMAYGGIAGLDGRKRYGIGSWFQEKIKDPIKEKFVDPAIDFVTDNPLLTAGGLGVLANYKDLIPGDISSEGWIGDLLGTGVQKVQDWLPKGITTDKVPFPDLPEDESLWTTAQKAAVEAWERSNLGGIGTTGGGVLDALFGSSQVGDQTVNWKTPLAIGTSMGAIQAAMPKDKFPMDETGIDFQTAQQAMADPELRFKPQAQYANVAEGGRIGAFNGGIQGLMPRRGRVMYPGGYGGKDDEYDTSWRAFTQNPGPDLTDLDIDDALRLGLTTKQVYHRWMDRRNWRKQNKAQGGRIGYRFGEEVDEPKQDNILENLTQEEVDKDPERYAQLLIGLREPDFFMGERGSERAYYIQPDNSRISVPWGFQYGTLDQYEPGTISSFKAQGGRIGAQEGGLMDMGGMEKDYRQEGGFVPIGGQEKADDVPARLSKNEFVFTADAVRAAGGGDIDAGAEIMENVMDNLEAGGKVSEESQGLEGAQEMFANAQQLQNRII